MTFTEQFLAEAAEILKQIDVAAVERVAATLAECRAGGGRLFILGVGGSAANASHAVNDFRKICGLEAYAPTDNVCELTARTNDEGWAGVFEGWLRVSRLRADGCAADLLGGRRQSGEAGEPEPGGGHPVRQVGGRESRRNRGARWRLHGAERRRLRDRAHGQREARHAARGGVSGRGLAPAGVASGAQAGGDQVGIGEVTKAVFLDRDGVLNHAIVRDGMPYPPADWTNWKSIPMRPERCAGSKQAGYLLIVVTNQPDIARGTQTRDAVDEINAALGAALPIDEFVVCAHDDADNCACRKPKPGMVLEAAARHAVDLRQSFLIGDRWRDIDCGASAGVRTVLIDRGYRERAPEHAPDFVAESLGAAADWILSA